MTYWQRRKQRKGLHALIHHARNLRHMREDVMAAADLTALDAAMQQAAQAARGGEAQAMTDADQALGELIEKLTPPCSLPGWRENFEVLVVALGVAMAFRAYFYQPFQIPTGSMQPTLYGISSYEQDAPRTCDQPVVKVANWLVSGQWFTRAATRRTGKVAVLKDDRVPGYTTVACGRWPGGLPPDSIYRRESAIKRKLADLGGRLGLSWFDRGYELHFIPNDVAGRHAGIYRADFVPDAAVQAQVVRTLRKSLLWLQAASADQATEEACAAAWQNLLPVAASMAIWSRGGMLDANSQQAAMFFYQVAEARHQGQPLNPALEKQVFRTLLPALTGWISAAEEGSPATPWFPLVSGCGVELPAGQLLWAGVVTEGDFVFVNRWAWNFRLPQRGEVMVFSTKGIRGLQQGTHYIKRMCGLPDETIAIHPPELWINGAAVYEPNTIARLVRREKLASWALPYAGYAVIGNVDAAHSPALRTPEDSIRLAADEYFAMGDNTRNSLDSRYWGPVPRRNLLGPAAMVYWPFMSKRWGRID